MKVAFLSLLAAAAFGQSTFALGENLNGRWAATTVQNGVTIPFRLEISGEGKNAVGTLFNGEEKQTTTSAKLDNGHVELVFDHYLVAIIATLKDGELDGRIENRRGPATERPRAHPFHATRYVVPSSAAAAKAPRIDGAWEIPFESHKGEKAWRLIVKQKGAEITATVLRVDGDTGALTGAWEDGKFVASHFDGARPGLLTLTPNADGTLAVDLHTPPRTAKFVAYRPAVARAKGFPEPANYQTHTSVRDPNEVFTFRFPDTNGKIVTNEDPRFKGKVVLAVVTGTWCPNCHDEAQYLVELYAKFHDKGLEIVALDFEEPEQQNTLKRVKAFISKYKIRYTYLIAGEPSELGDKIPQAVNLNTWPATLFIGRDGKVKATHAGFAGPASGLYHQKLREEFTSNIERLLKERAPAEISAVAGR